MEGRHNCACVEEEGKEVGPCWQEWWRRVCRGGTSLGSVRHSAVSAKGGAWAMLYKSAGAWWRKLRGHRAMIGI
eukprot:14657996-Alexandrium_andersonii.AAC.1